jgi:ABC-type multidrug transport system ATPase subunit
MPAIHKIMGVCPQHDLLWAALSGREHLQFYGRLKGLSGLCLPVLHCAACACQPEVHFRPHTSVRRKVPHAARCGHTTRVHPGTGPELDATVHRCLAAVRLWGGGIADKPSGSYSGGMQRRLSVAIALMGNPAVVYLDEPSTVRRCARRDCLGVNA